MLCSNLGNKNFDAGHIKCLCGPHLARRVQFPCPYCREMSAIMVLFLKFLHTWFLLIFDECMMLLLTLDYFHA